MNYRYIEFDSTYRNRASFPSPAEFEVPIAQNGNNDRFSAVDPVSRAAPLSTFTGAFDIAANSITITGVVSALGAGVGAATDIVSVVVEVTAGEMQQAENYYVGAILNDTTTGQLRRIKSFRYLETTGGVDRGVFVVVPAFTSISAGDAITITNPSSNSGTNSHIFIPFGEIFQDNYLVNLILTDETIGESLTIQYYDADLELAELNGTFGGGWAATDSYVIRLEAPIESGVLTGSTINTFTLPVTFTNIFEFYTGSFIRILSGPAIGDSRRIVQYSNATVPTRVGTVFPPFSAIPGLASFEILPFTKDNFNPINYTGSLASQEQEVCYEVELSDVTVPNKTLNVQGGNRIVFHPYIEVELSNTTSMSNSHIIYSNNPNNPKALFRVPVSDIREPIVSSYIRLSPYRVTQTIKFKPNDTLRFRVTMPNGQLFSTRDSEYFSPSVPNPDIQISALFGVKRLG